MENKKRVAVIGLDCAPPELVFEQWSSELPTLTSLRERGLYGKLASCVPPITVPAWSCMTSSKDPGELGIYGFRNRKDYSYDGMVFSDCTSVREPRVWDILSRQGKQVIVLAVPGTYPPKPVNGCMVGCFLTPNISSEYTYPTTLKAELEKQVGPYIMDVANFRSDDKARILQQLYEMTAQHFAMAKWLVTNKPWDFFMMVEMGTDRIQHAFWKYHDPQHRKHEPGNEFLHAIKNYYKALDRQIADLLPHLGDDTAILVVSDHGAKRMDGGICINEWLMQKGYLTLKEPVNGPTPISKAKIDWSRTIAWGEGGYYSRIFMNVKGREPQGIVEPSQYEEIRSKLKRELEEMLDDQGNRLGNEIHRPQDIYRKVRGVAPDLIAIFGHLHWRSVGTIGTGSAYTFENDTGPDEANHAENGILIMADSAISQPGTEVEGMRIFDVAPTILDRFGIDAPADMLGKAITLPEGEALAATGD